MRTPLNLILLMTLVSLNLNGQSAFTDVGVGIEEHLDEYLPMDVVLINENNESVELGSLIDKPTIINLVYYRCPGICSPLMEGLANVMDKVDMKLGQEYQVLTISFDPRENIEMAKMKKNNYLNLMSNPDAAQEHWKFFVSDSGNIEKLTSAVGFNYIQRGNDFLHAASICIVSPEGKITRYLNGTYFLPLEVTLAVTEASQGISAPTVNRILQFCFAFDPVGQTYVLNATRIGFIVIMFTAVVLVLVLTIRTRKNRKINIA